MGTKKRVKINYNTVCIDEKNMIFSSSVKIEEEKITEGRGSNKKEAEQNAAKASINILMNEYGDYIGPI